MDDVFLTTIKILVACHGGLLGLVRISRAFVVQQSLKFRDHESCDETNIGKDRVNHHRVHDFSSDFGIP